MSCHVMSCHVMSCHVMSSHVMSCVVGRLEVLAGCGESGMKCGSHFETEFMYPRSVCPDPIEPGSYYVGDDQSIRHVPALASGKPVRLISPPPTTDTGTGTGTESDTGNYTEHERHTSGNHIICCHLGWLVLWYVLKSDQHMLCVCVSPLARIDMHE